MPANVSVLSDPNTFSIIRNNNFLLLDLFLDPEIIMDSRCPASIK